MSRLLPTLALLLALLPTSSARAQSKVELARALVFPPGEEALERTLEVPLATLLAAEQKRVGHAPRERAWVLHKARRRLDVLVDGVAIKSYLVDLGEAPEGAKTVQGDRKTPEGDYFLCTVNKQSQFTRFLGIGYPTVAEAEVARKAGLIDESTLRATRAAWKAKDRCPPQQTKLGGWVGIHGKGDWARSATGFTVVDWTWGCVGLRDADVLELFTGFAAVGQRIRIEP